MSDRYIIEKLDIEKHGNGLGNLWQTVSKKYPKDTIASCGQCLKKRSMP